MVEFSKSLRPAVEGYTEYENGAWWCFDRKGNFNIIVKPNLDSTIKL